jgi:DNA modification methylase
MKPVIKCNDNLTELRKISSGSIDLVYIDPQYFTQRKWKDFDDTWKNIDDYISFMKPRVEEIHRILKPDGSMYLQSDHHADAYLRVMADKVFGYDNIVNVIKWEKPHPKNNIRRSFSDNSDTILFYAKGKGYTFNQQFKPLSSVTMKNYKYKDKKGVYRFVNVDAPGGKKFDLGLGEKSPSRGYGTSKEKLLDMHRKGLLVVRTGKIPVKKRYLQESPGVPMSASWDGIDYLVTSSKDNTGYATQKPKKLLERIILASSNKGDTVLDAFAGSGTTCDVAQKLGRKSICIDVNPRACKIMEDRLK